MFFINDAVLLRTLIFLLAMCGFLVARYIHKHKKPDQKPLYCPVGFDCEAVVRSDYSTFFGVPLEIFGMVYYAVVSMAYLVLIFAGGQVPLVVSGILIIMSLSAFLFSLYLIAVQIFVLQKGCSWCLISSLISASIFLITMLAYDFALVVQTFLK